MSERQRDLLLETLRSRHITEFHHGDCIGADDEAADLVSENFPDIKIVCHPPIDETHRAFNNKHQEIRVQKKHFARNRDIVDETDFTTAAPLTTEHQDHGGTWYTHDYAIKKKKETLVLPR